jgi:hypothetical protein
MNETTTIGLVRATAPSFPAHTSPQRCAQPHARAVTGGSPRARAMVDPVAMVFTLDSTTINSNRMQITTNVCELNSLWAAAPHSCGKMG